MRQPGFISAILMTLPTMLISFGCGKKILLQKEKLKTVESWVCVYSSDAPVEQIRKFDLAVLDSDSHPDLSKLSGPDIIVLGYVSLGEAADYRWYWDRVAGKSWILHKNPNWNGRMIDVRNPEWSDLLVQEIIPRVLQKGFNGLFLDTIDNAEYLERYHPEKKYPGCERAMVELIKSIRRSFPNIYLVANRGFAILNEIAYSIDGVVAESIFTDIDFKNRTTRIRTPEEFEPIVGQLKSVRKKHGIKVFTLDYPNLLHQSEVERLLSRSRGLGFVPYMSTPELDKVYLYTL